MKKRPFQGKKKLSVNSNLYFHDNSKKYNFKFWICWHKLPYLPLSLPPKICVSICQILGPPSAADIIWERSLILDRFKHTSSFKSCTGCHQAHLLISGHLIWKSPYILKSCNISSTRIFNCTPNYFLWPTVMPPISAPALIQFSEL